ncbi:site-2 protease family protein [Opitutus sp. ER46]|uniref:site-2 protease family protein n=1 Tax=Opitutus sp. ER46 TaxID=2161864 RepID=UPI001E540A99|nr:site-2 protease family protein [Opitutus sp. ER46]
MHSSFFLLLGFVAWEGWQADPKTGQGGGWVDMAWNVGILLAFFTCVVLHELGHSLTAMQFGVGVRRILLMPIGGMAEFDTIPRQPARELLITVAGPAVNFAIAGLIFLFIGAPAGWPWGQYGFTADARGFAQLLAHWNLIMGLFNLVPVFPMDGGRILRAALASRLPYLRATRIAANIAKVLAGIGIIGVIAVPLFYGESPLYLTAALLGFILIAGELEYRAAIRRERDDAHWRETIARIHQAESTPPTDEPPLLRS